MLPTRQTFPEVLVLVETPIVSSRRGLAMMRESPLIPLVIPKLSISVLLLVLVLVGILLLLELCFFLILVAEKVQYVGLGRHRSAKLT